MGIIFISNYYSDSNDLREIEKTYQYKYCELNLKANF